ncbi:hypothetical protein GE21DRAFT_7041 [Neurospora crassa]|uniref:Uncharacterized protein n=1 Tax=Neurospora crassa (strain ATCC 24698 / 74-OR23-1A / CBS 708.71 / DSM 1257 / FGSC 987) TaxID=367110 RepID=Q7S3B3_NEUCR|nr:hypothetical protein NCU04661 [Neurospora crassa OR74A]EAA29968.2 hypothetical protein NCU04661 [Neurospora crassa OR74A]KHE83411.1 hypothetical protein GE21DRAFT_7041 [Neurospora crassa]|eukprot:XP_959204.2 hypothetical protein NCU04661 [Neurospora crassa OR74A]
MAPSSDQTMSRPESAIISPSIKTHSRSRALSISSDKPSTIATSFMSPPLTVSPEAAFIAASAASQIITNDHDSHADTWLDQHGIEPSSEPALVSPAALQLVNNFLDHLLFNFISVARSATLAALRAAITEVLKPKLAKDVISQADEELQEYMGDTEEDILDPSATKDWDLELIWKRTRLRCMVYSSLGDLEEEDEDYYMEKELLSSRQEDQSSELVSSAASVFLTSIIEYLGEQALTIAGQAAFQRIRVKYEKELKEGLRKHGVAAEQIVVQEHDMERVALDRTLGRLWRTWKKKIRSPLITNLDRGLSHSFSRDSMRSSRGTPTHLRSSSVTETPVPETIPEPTNGTGAKADANETGTKKTAKEETVEEYLIAAAIPLPMGENDVEEIEGVSLLARSQSRDGAKERAARKRAVRPKSLMVWPVTKPANPPTPTLSPSHTPLSASKKRSNSLPTPTATPSGSPVRTDPQASELAPLPSAVERNFEQSRTSDDTQPVRGEKSDNLKGAEISPVEASLVGAPASSQQAETKPRTQNSGNSETEDEVKDSDESEYDDEFLDEEPQILTSSRISISGRSSSPAVSEQGRPAPINTTLGRTRTPSIYSARLIEVTSPRSPSTAARNSPILDSSEHMRLSRSSSLRTASITEERLRYSPDSASGARISGHGGNKSALSAQVAPENVSPVTDDGVLEAIPEPPSPDELEGHDFSRGSNPFVGSIVERGSPGSSPIRSTPKITTPTSSAGTFYFEDRPKPAPKHHAQSRPRVSVVPEMPDRSSIRRSPSNHSMDDRPTSIGKISVQRSRGRSPSETGFISRFPEPPKPGVMVRHETASSISSTSTRSTNKLRLVRTSEEGSTAGQSRQDVARNFEELIQSDQTIQFTLTPESMRDIDSQSTRSVGSAILSVKTRKSQDSRRDSDRSRSSSSNRKKDAKKDKDAHSQHPLPESNRNSNNSTASGPILHAIPQPPRAHPPQARDPRIARESVADFADFIRATGPTGINTAAMNRSSGQQSGLRDSSGPVSPPYVPLITEAPRPLTARPLTARDPHTEADDNSDLIDFIRRGPPTAGNPRIPQAVAPFRSTPDSDQMSTLEAGGKAADAQLHDVDVRNSQASTDLASNSMHSLQSSVNSQSALLSKNKSQPTTATGRFEGIEEDDVVMPMPSAMPQRKRRGPRDPYAIDLTDEEDFDEDDDYPVKPKRPPTNEESLMDFLRNVPPPPEPTVSRVVTSPKQPQPKKKSSATSLMSRFTRRESKSNVPPSSSGSMSPQSPIRPNESRGLSRRPSASSGRGYTPIQVHMPPGVDRYAPSSVNHNPNMPMSRGRGMSQSSGITAPRVAMKRFEPRDAYVAPTSELSDLASFLKNSTPPPSMGAAAPFDFGGPPPPTASATSSRGGDGVGDSNSFSRVFSRRSRKASVV